MNDTFPSIPADDPSRTLVVASPEDAALTHLALAGGSYTILVSGADSGDRYTLIDMLVPPAGGPPPHRHDFDEAFILLEGELEFTFRGETRAVAAPATVAIPANAPHAFRNVSNRQVHMLCLCAPAGQDEYFTLVGTRIPSRDAPQPKLSDAEQSEKRALALALAAQFRTEFAAR